MLLRDLHKMLDHYGPEYDNIMVYAYDVDSGEKNEITLMSLDHSGEHGEPENGPMYMGFNGPAFPWDDPC